jgi:GTPase SAR1 family protein
VTNKETLERSSQWVEAIRAEAPKDCIICLTGNKIDLEKERVISTDDMIEHA